MIPDLEDVYRPFVDTIVMVVFIVVATRVNGLRSFSKLSGFDFAITVAMGSVLASVVVGSETPFLTGVAAIVALFATQALIAKARVRWLRFEKTVDNEPLLLMDGAEVLADNLDAADVTRDDLVAKLREANVIDPSQIRAVVLETTGDINVLHASTDGPELSDMVMWGVRRQL